MIRIEGIPILAARLEQAGQRTKKTLIDTTDYGTGGFSVINEWALRPLMEHVSKTSGDGLALRSGLGVKRETENHVSACC